jgi:hypothetical protein
MLQEKWEKWKVKASFTTTGHGMLGVVLKFVVATLLFAMMGESSCCQF